MARTPAWLRAAMVGGLALNALDITTSLIPSPADHIVGIPARSSAAWLVQLALLVPLLVWAVRRLPALIDAYRRLPIPAVPRGVLAAFFAVALVHVALRFERYPWSPVAMFSSAVPVAQGNAFSRMGYVIVRGDNLEAVSLVMHMYAPTTRKARDVLYERVAREGLPEPVRTRVSYSRADGHLLLKVHWR
jgi:hypothetical protein